MTKPLLFAVIGEPINHSKSPRMHGAAYAALGMPHRYEALLTHDSEVEARVQAVRDGTFAGLSVTVPHKQAVMLYADIIDASAQGVGAANTLVRNPEGLVVAYNTDVPALAGELRRLAPERTAEEWAAHEGLVIGTGGAARAALVGFAVVGVKRIFVRARSMEKAHAFESLLPQAGFDDVTVTVEPLEPGKCDERFVALIQATSAGMQGAEDGEPILGAVNWDALPSRAVALDVVYSPPETPFLRRARTRGLRADNGFGMLVTQGALAFAMWLGVKPPLDVMRAALAP
jgi:shikimate dehydrogenase